MDWQLLLGIGFGLVLLLLRRAQRPDTPDDEPEVIVCKGDSKQCAEAVAQLAETGIAAWRCADGVGVFPEDAEEAEKVLDQTRTGALPGAALLSAVLLWASLVCGPLHGASAVQNEILSDDEIEAAYIARRQEKAADYRLARERVYRELSEAHHEEAAAMALAIGRLLERGEVAEARRAIYAAQRSHGYSRSAGLLQHQLLRTWLAVGDTREAKIALVDLAERFTDYPDIDIAIRESLLVARKMQTSGQLINLQAETPRDVINTDAIANLIRTDRIFKYLADPVNSDRDVAPEAALLYARSLLARGYGSKDKLVLTRIAYEYLLTEFPESRYVFDALCELAVTHLLVYRGDQYDVGALITASSLIKRARSYINDQPEREEIIAQYEQMILHWHQGRDFQVAKWYEDNDKIEAARFYYGQAEAHDPASTVGLAATRALANLPPPPDTVDSTESVEPTPVPSIGPPLPAP